MNVVMGMVVEHAFKVVQRDRDWMIFEKRGQREQYEHQVNGVLYELESAKNGTVTRLEFDRAMNDPHIEAKLSLIDLTTSDLHAIFEMAVETDVNSVKVERLMQGIHEFVGHVSRVELRKVLSSVAMIPTLIERI